MKQIYVIRVVDTGFGVFEPGLDYLYEVFSTYEEAKKWVEERS